MCLRVEGDRLERTISSPNSIAKEIISRLEEMEQQGGNWILEEIKGALMDDIRAIIQDEMRQALTGLMPPPPAAAIPIAPTIPLLYLLPRANPRMVLKLCLLYK